MVVTCYIFLKSQSTALICLTFPMWGTRSVCAAAAQSFIPQRRTSGVKVMQAFISRSKNREWWQCRGSRAAPEDLAVSV